MIRKQAHADARLLAHGVATYAGQVGRFSDVQPIDLAQLNDLPDASGKLSEPLLHTPKRLPRIEVSLLVEAAEFVLEQL